MKKYFCGIFIFIMVLGAFCGCKKQTLPVPEYPLDEAAIAAALQEAGLSWTIGEVDSDVFEGQTLYALYKDDGKMVASISSAIRNEEKFLHIAFASSYYNAYYNYYHSLPEEEWERAIVLATLLYGSLESTHQVYDLFRKEYGTENTQRQPRERITGSGIVTLYGEQSWWEREINGVHCWVLLVQEHLSMSQEYLGVIRFASDLDTFNLRG